jgi:hypothetical protein
METKKMKFIIQSPLEVYGLAQAHASPPHTSEQATSRWSSFRHKDTVLRCLLRQQYQLCCYSEVRADLLGISHHIEHVENKSQNPARTFDETNLAASALSTDDIPRLQKADVFGGMLLVSALQSTLHSSFPVLAGTALAIFTICLMEELYRNSTSGTRTNQSSVHY